MYISCSGEPGNKARDNNYPVVDLERRGGERRIHIECTLLSVLRNHFWQNLPAFLLHSSDSDLSDLEEPPPTLHLSQSCDIEVHRPIGREVGDSVAKQPDQVETLVDKGVVHQSMELSQRFSMETISKEQPAKIYKFMDKCYQPFANLFYPQGNALMLSC